MSEQHPPGVDPNVGRAGVVDENETYDMARSQLVPDKEEPRDVKIRVPAGMTDQHAMLIWNIGSQTLDLLGSGRVVINFPSIGKHPKTGEPVPTIGKFEMIVAKPEDVHRLLKLATIINQQNVKIAQAQRQPANLLAASIEGTKAKDEALSQLSQEANGQRAIVTAKDQPQIMIGR